MKTSKDFRDRNIRQLEERISKLKTMGNSKDVLSLIEQKEKELIKIK